MERVREEAAIGRTVDLTTWWTCMATDIVGMLGFRGSVGMLELGRMTAYIRARWGMGCSESARA